MLTGSFEAMTGVTITPSARESVQNAINLLSLALQHQSLAKTSEGCKNVHIRPVEELHVRLSNHRPIRLSKPSSRRHITNHLVLAIKEALRSLPVSRRGAIHNSIARPIGRVFFSVFVIVSLGFL